jgi:hypothetical protein
MYPLHQVVTVHRLAMPCADMDVVLGLLWGLRCAVLPLLLSTILGLSSMPPCLVDLHHFPLDSSCREHSQNEMFCPKPEPPRELREPNCRHDNAVEEGVSIVDDDINLG